VCGVVVEEASREGEVTSSNHGSRGVRDLRLDDEGRVGGWPVGFLS
jgi:hypothetical protein